MIIAAICFIGLIYYPQIDKNLENTYVKNASTVDSMNNNLTQEEQRVINNSNEREQTFDIVNVIRRNSNPDDKIYTHRLGGNLYLLSERLSSIKYFNLPSANINENPLIGEDFISDIKQNHTELIVLSSYFNNREKTGYEKDFFDYVTNNYNLIYDQNNHHIYRFIS